VLERRGITPSTRRDPVLKNVLNMARRFLTGQRDPEIYLQTAREHPGRILAAYIRDVTTPERDAEVRSIAAAACELGGEMVLVKDTATAARHALERGLLAPNVPAPGR
jgi:phosphatidate phosphatase APP1